MTSKHQYVNLIALRPGRFLLRVLIGFKRNQGILLSGAVAYYSLLSIVPMLALMLVVLSHFVEEAKLLNTVASHLKIIVPGYSARLLEQVRIFLLHREVVGIVTFLVMLFFSSMAFTVLENAMSVIFFHRVRVHRRHFLTSAIIPYVYIFLLSIGLLLVSFIAGGLEAFEDTGVEIFGFHLNLEGASGTGLYLLGMFGMAFMLTSLYLVMPVGRIAFRHALIGGVTATILWEICRHVLVWYFSSLSLVNVIYGSLATAVVALLSIEIAAMILLFGAQVIAEFERNPGATAVEEQSGFET